MYGFATLSGAAIVIFVMGMGTVYSKRSEAMTLAKSGIVMIGYQHLSNIAYIDVGRKAGYKFSAGLRVLLASQKKMKQQSDMIIKNANDMIMDVFQVTGFIDILAIE